MKGEKLAAIAGALLATISLASQPAPTQGSGESAWAPTDIREGCT